MGEQDVKPPDRVAALREALAKHIGYSKAVHSRGTELPWCWSDTGEKSNDFAIGTASTVDSDDAPMAEGYVDSARVDSMEVIPIDEVCAAENADFADAELIVAAVNAAPELLATIDRLSAQLATLKEYLHFEVDDDGEHHFDWVAGYQSAEKENAKLVAQLATARKGLQEVADGRCSHEPRCDYKTNGVSINSCSVTTAYATLAAIDEKGMV